MRQQPAQHTHLLGYIRQEIGKAIRHVIVALLVAVAGGALAVEVGAIMLSGQVPTMATHIAATVVAVALGYAAAITVLFRALLQGIGHGAEWVTSELEDTTRRILHSDGSEAEGGTQRVVMGSAVSAAPAPHSSERGPASRAATLNDGMLAGFHAE